MSDLLIFLHIPKTAGTSLRWVLEGRYPPRSVLRCYPILGCTRARLEEMPDAARRRISLISTHLPYGLHDLFPQPSTYVTMLRDPVDRWISRYFSREPPPPATGITEAVGRLGADSRDNRQVRLIAAVPDGQAVEPHHLDVAERRLRRRFAAVGLTERFAASLALFGRTLGFRPVTYVTRNATRKRPPVEELSPRLREAIREAHVYDIALYERARRLFDDRLLALGVSAEEVAATVQPARRWDRGRFLASRALRRLRSA